MLNNKMNLLEQDRIKEIQLNILNIVVDYCEENEITYYLTGGTLLGAVRHKGFIPWDDDIDLNMPRKDYDLFFSTFNQFRNDSMVAISIETDKEYYLANGKVFDSNTILLEDINENKEIGVNIDIFPLDDLPSDLKSRKKLLRKIGILRLILSLKQIKIDKERTLLKNCVLAVSQFALKPINKYRILAKITALSKSYNGLDCCTYTAAVATLIWGNKEIFQKEYFNSTIKLEFEGRLFNCPIAYDKVLRQVYGDYMELPPMEKRISHHRYKVYEKQ